MMKTAASEKDRKVFLRKELKEYMQNTVGMTKSEINELREWVASGNSVYDNPYFYSDDSGWPMDYISAMRFDEEICAQMAGRLEASPPSDGDLDDETDSIF